MTSSSTFHDSGTSTCRMNYWTTSRILSQTHGEDIRFLRKVSPLGYGVPRLQGPQKLISSSSEHDFSLLARSTFDKQGLARRICTIIGQRRPSLIFPPIKVLATTTV